MANVIIPNHLAGVGDVVCVKFSGGEVSDKIVIKGTTFSSAPSGYTLYGTIYGFEKGCARLCANVRSDPEAPKYSWAAPASGDWPTTWSAGGIVGDTTIDWGSITMRNGLKGTYANMNTSKVASLMTTDDASHDAVHPTSAYYGSTTAMSRNHFNTADTANAKLARQIYKTYEEYLDQMSPLLTPEVAIADENPLGGCFSIRCGKENTATLGVFDASHLDTTAGNTAPCWYPAANYCYNYAVIGENSHHWWLPDMNELEGIFEEANYNKIQTTTGINKPSTGSYYWSCVRHSATRAWRYNVLGVSDSYYFSDGLTALPVTLLKL